MKLNIWKNKKIEKTYECDSYHLMYGTIMDLTKALNLKEVANLLDEESGSNEFVQSIANMIYDSMDLINGILIDMFDGLTEEELKRTHIDEIVQVIVDVAGNSIPLIKRIKSKTGSKN